MVRKFARKAKNYRKIIKLIDENIAASDAETIIHTVTDPSTLKRVIIDYSQYCDAISAQDKLSIGLYIRANGVTAPTIANIEAEESRWLWFKQELQSSQTSPAYTHIDMKIQRKLKVGDILAIAVRGTSAGDLVGSSTVIIDET